MIHPRAALAAMLAAASFAAADDLVQVPPSASTGVPATTIVAPGSPAAAPTITSAPAAASNDPPGYANVPKILVGAAPAETVMIVGASSECAPTVSVGTCVAGRGLRCGCAKCKGQWRQPVPPPTGAAVRNFLRQQADAALPSEMVIHKHEWYRGGDMLGPFGRRHLEAIAFDLWNTGLPVLVEPLEDHEQDQRRLAFIVNALASAGLADAHQRVRLGFSKAEGLFGDEAPLIYTSGIATRGNNAGRGGIGAGGFGAGLGGLGGGLGGFGGGGFGGGAGGFGGSFGGFR